MNLGPTELIIILLIALLLFGGAKLPKLARSLGEAQKEFKSATDEGRTGVVRSAEEVREDEVRRREAEVRQREDDLRRREEGLRREGDDPS